MVRKVICMIRQWLSCMAKDIHSCGQSAVIYALILGTIAVAGAGTVAAVNRNVDNKMEGAEARITGSGTRASENFIRVDPDLDMTVFVSDYRGEYDGEEHTGVVAPSDPVSGYTIMYGLTEGTYDLSDSPTFTEIGTNKVYFRVDADGYHTYYGVFKVEITYQFIDIPTVSGLYTFDGTEKSAVISDTYDSERCSYTGTTKGTNAGVYTITFRLKNTTSTRWRDGTTGNKSATWTINRRSLGDVTIAAVPTKYYTGDYITPAPAVTFAGMTLNSGTDFTYNYADNKDVGTATITITAKENSNYTGRKTVRFVIDYDRSVALEILSQPTDCAAGVGQTASFTVGARGVKSFTWQYSSDDGRTWGAATGTGINTDTLSVTASEASYLNDRYRCELFGVNGETIHTESARIIRPTYTISYNTAGGSNGPESQTKSYGVPLTLATKTPTKSSAAAGSYSVSLNANGGTVSTDHLTAARTTVYRFLGWNTISNGSGTSYSPGGEYTANAGATLYAQWAADDVRTDSVTLPQPSRTGYIFRGWSEDSEAMSGTMDTVYYPTADTILHAVWEPEKYPVNYDANGGTGAPESQVKVYGETLTLATQEPVRADTSAGNYTVTLNPNGGSVDTTSLSAARTTHYTFICWNTAQNGGGTRYDPGALYTENEGATMYAQWDSYITTASVTLPTPTREGHDFMGWATSGSATSGMTGSYTPSDNITLIAIWKAHTYTVSYNANGGTGAPASQTKTYGIDLTLSTTIPSRSNSSAAAYTVTLHANDGSGSTSSLTAARTNHYTFTNWNTTQNGSGTSYSAGAKYTVNGPATMYAQWSVNTTTASVTLPTPTREGYDFIGWGTSSTATSGSTGSYTPTGNVALYAVWQLKTYTVSYDANGGTGAPAAQTKTHGTALTLSSTTPSKSSASAGSYTVTFNANGGSCSTSSLSAARTTSYTFSKWNTAQNGSGTNYNPGGSYTANAAVTLYAQWNSSTSTAAISLPTPTRDGYNFNGWSTSSTATSGSTGSYTPTGDVTLYATWQAKTYTVSYNANGGTGAPAAQTKTHGTALTLSSTTPSKSSASAGSYTVTFNANGGSCSTSSLSAARTTSYTFSKWNTAQNGSGTNYNPGGSYTANAAVTLYAQWNSSTSTAAISLPTPTRDGYNFNGWSTSSTATSGSTGSYTPTGDVTLYATWQAKTYTVSYNANGGTGAPAAQTKTHGTALTLSSTQPTRSNASAGSYTVTFDANGGSCSTSSLSAARSTSYTFSKWNTAQNGSGTNYNPGGSYTTNASATLYAQWNSSTSTAAISLPTPTRDGYNFNGWSTSSTATSGSTGSYTPTGNVTLYATWEPFGYTISFNANGGTNPPASQTKIHGEALTLTTSKPTAPSSASAGSYTVTFDANGGSCSTSSLSAARTTNYTFSKWNTAQNGSGTNYNPGGSYTTNASATLYAQWDSSASTAAISLPTPTRDGYNFNGWSTSSTATSGSTGSYTPTGDVTLYATWQAKTYTVSYNANGGTGAPAAQTKTHDTTLTLTSSKPSRSSTTAGSYTITLNANGGSCSTSSVTSTRRTYYTFSKWNTAQNGSGTSYNPGGSYTDNASATLYAQWTSSTRADKVNLPTAVTRDGYNFAGWNTSTSATSGFTSYTPTSNKTLYAIWVRKTYTVSYDANGGSGAPASQTKTHNVNLTLTGTVPSRASTSAGSYTVTFDANGGTCSTSSLTAARTTTYSFASWNTNAGGTGAAYAPGSTYTTNAAATLFAQWNSSTSTTAITLPTPSREGYNFRGWSTSSSATSGSTGSYTPTGNVTFYATWEIRKYTITWKNWDGTTLETDDNVPYGSTPSYDGATPTRPADAEVFDCVFTGWSPNVSTVTGNVTYTATYSYKEHNEQYNGSLQLKNPMRFRTTFVPATGADQSKYSIEYTNLDGVTNTKTGSETSGELILGNFTAMQMSLNYHYVVKYDGVIIKDVYVSPRDICEGRIKANSSQKDLFIGLLEWGTSAQLYFDRNTGDLANKNLPSIIPGYSNPIPSISVPSTYAYTVDNQLEEVTRITHAFDYGTTSDPMRLWVRIYGFESKPTVTSNRTFTTGWNSDEGRIAVIFKLPSSLKDNADYPITITVTNKAGESMVIHTQPFSSCYASQGNPDTNVANCAKGFYNVVLQAKKYL